MKKILNRIQRLSIPDRGLWENSKTPYLDRKKESL